MGFLAGRITRERARECLQEFFVFVDAQTPRESSNHDKGGENHMTVGWLTRDAAVRHGLRAACS